jgi:amidase
VPQPGDPFLIPRPAQSYAEIARAAAPRLRIGWSSRPLMGFPVDAEVAAAVERTARLLADMGHHVEEHHIAFDGMAAMRAMLDVWFFGFDLRLAGYSQRSGHAIGPDTLEPVIWKVYEYARQMKPAQFLAGMAMLNTSRRQLGAYFTAYDVWLSPTTSRVAEPWGNYNLGRADVSFAELPETIYRPVCQFSLPHNIMGTPAISLPLFMHTSGLPIGVQLAAGPAQEHVLLKLATALEDGVPWSDRVPPLHVSRSAS